MLSYLRAPKSLLLHKTTHLSRNSQQIQPLASKQIGQLKYRSSRPICQWNALRLQSYTTGSQENQEPEWFGDDEGEEDHPLTHKEAVELMDKNELIKNDMAYKIFLETDPGKFATVPFAEELKAEGFNEAETEEGKKYENELYMDNWLHSAMTVVGIVSILDGELDPGCNVLDLACGNGYMSVVLAKLVSPGGSVISVDFDADKLKSAKATVKTHFPELMETIQWKEQDIFTFKEGTFDAIHVGGGLSEVPQDWLGLLRPGGCLIAATPEIEPQSGENHYMLRKYLVRPEGGVLPINLMYVNYEALREPSL